ncbi:MAG: hypothetical protein Ct9H300mP5_5370 [Candidatus Pelagibacterales bacterium]|nr:MAG: hypothetical protein Ct9H300mP5_5370 [Pelagibacterales bacterium]
MFVTGIIGNYDIISEEIKWVNAGHQPALIRHTKGNFEELNQVASFGSYFSKKQIITKLIKKI